MTTTQVRGRQLKPGWDDLAGNVGLGKIPTSNAPSWTTWDHGIGGGVAFQVLGYGLDEYQDFTYQSSHAMELNTVLSDHIHWGIPSDDEGKQFKFRIDVIAAGVDEQWAVPDGSPFYCTVTLGASESGYHRLDGFDPVIPAVNTTVSTLYKVRLKRVAVDVPANEYGSDVFIDFHDAHYIKDQIGSESIYSKQEV